MIITENTIKKLTRLVTEKVDQILLKELSSQKSNKLFRNIHENDEPNDDVFAQLDEMKIKTSESDRPYIFIIGRYVPLEMNVVVMIKNYDEIYIARVIKNNLININNSKILTEIAETFDMEPSDMNATAQFNNVFDEVKPAKDFAAMINARFNSKISHKKFMNHSLINESAIYENEGQSVYSISAINVTNDEPLFNGKYDKKYFTEKEAIIDARTWAEDMSIDSDEVICVTVMAGKDSTNKFIDPYDVYTISTQNEETTRQARKDAGYVRDTVDEYVL